MAYTDPTAVVTGDLYPAATHNTDVVNNIKYLYSSIVPAGCMMGWGAASPPPGWLTCDGSSVLRSTYAALFAAIGTTFGSADGTHFTLPDFRGRAPIGAGTGSGLTARTLAANVGAETVTLSTAEIPSHTHVQDAHTHTQNSHNHTQDAHAHTNKYQGLADGGGGPLPVAFDGGAGTASDTVIAATATNQAATATNQNTTATNQNAGGGGAHANVQPSLVVNMIIKT